jgi:L-aspartate oxidase
MQRQTVDGVLILGAGLAGLSAALAVADQGRRALVISPATLGAGCASSWAQGGMAVAMGADDTPGLHAEDTMEAGAGLCDPEAVRVLTTEGPEAVRRLLGLGAPFDRDAQGALVQSLEAAHSRARVARVGGDGAGAAIMAAVIQAVRAEPRVEIWEAARALALLTDTRGAVRGALIERGDDRIEIVANAVILATGGVGGLYATTTDPAEVRGQGLALAALAGAVIADPEFVQFHPTAIDIASESGDLDPAPLATEALRGEGATLIDAAGRPFMQAYHPQGDLAPRDVVARAVAAEKAKGGAWLDARAAIGAHFPAEFPAVFKACMAAGLDPRIQPIPVAPAVHYHMGGVWTDLDGCTSVSGLYAAGECASTGVHGANRLASNSLLEAAVFGTRAGKAAAGQLIDKDDVRILPAEPAPSLPHVALQRLRKAMDLGAGVSRDAASLTRLIDKIHKLEAEHGRALELITARLVAEAALARQHSRGAHFRSDFPELGAVRHTLRTLTTRPALMAAE